MNKTIRLQNVFAETGDQREQQVALFAFLCLGLLDALASGTVSASEAVHLFFNAENCLFVHRHLDEKTADSVMSHGVQLPDLFQALPAESALREFQHELSIMRSLCTRMLEPMRMAA